MANWCDNELRIYSENEENINTVKKFLKDNFLIDKLFEDVDILEISFNSKWYFPEDLMNDLINKLPDKNDINMVCLSVEWGNLYCEFHTYNEGKWTN